MPDLVKYGIIFLVAIVTGIILTVIIFNLIKKNNENKMYDDVYFLLQSLIPDDETKDSFKIEKNSSNDFDYIFQTPNYTYYIKIIKNFGSHEICINNATKWQIRKSLNDNSMNFVENVEGLMRLDVDDTKKKKKLYIIYPNARSLLKYINECEMVFVKPNTDVYGTNVISYLAVEKDNSLIKL